MLKAKYEAPKVTLADCGAMPTRPPYAEEYKMIVVSGPINQEPLTFTRMSTSSKRLGGRFAYEEH